MYFPRRDAAPDTLHVRIDDISLQKPTYSFCVGVKFYVSEEELADFSHSENIFIAVAARDRLGLVCIHSRFGPA
jgi:hypothetical protein